MKKLFFIVGLFVFACGGSALIHANVANVAKCTNSTLDGNKVNRTDSVVPGDTAKIPVETPPDSTKKK
jgi:hypothetical protein